MRCAACGAFNAADAAWCTQCYERFRSASTDDGDPVREDAPPPSEDAASGPVAGVAPTPVGRSDGDHQRDVRDRDGIVEWRCGVCDGWTDLARASCAACGSPRTGFGLDDAAPRSTSLPSGQVTAASVVLPGLGHLMTGRVAAGLARMLLALLWLVGGLSIALGDGTGTVRLPGVVLLLGAATLWVGSAIDAREFAAGGNREVLANRTLLWLVATVTGLLTLSLFVVATVGS